jgi:hypothetical protein
MMLQPKDNAIVPWKADPRREMISFFAPAASVQRGNGFARIDAVGE